MVCLLPLLLGEAQLAAQQLLAAKRLKYPDPDESDLVMGQLNNTVNASTH